MADAAAGGLPEELWQKWEKQGKLTFVKTMKKLSKDAKNHEAVARMVLDLLQKNISGAVKKDSLSSTFAEILPLNDQAPTILLDALYALDSGISDDDEEQRQNLYNIVKELEKCLPEALLKERIEIETLFNVGTLKNKNFRTKFIRLKTKLYYKQKKFNLLREESEGYAKLITELNQEENSGLTSAKIWEATKSLIGCFNLDPNRVVDLILEALELRTECANVFIEVLRNFADVQSVICEILGFKFVHYHRNKGQTPRSLYILAALLLQKEMLTLDQLYPWLMPLDSVIEKDWEALMEKHKNAVKKINSLMINKDKDDNEVDNESPREKYMRNQKLGLCEALLVEGAWPLARNLVTRLPPRCAISHPPISHALCAIVHAVIEPVYSKFGSLPSKVKRTPVPPLVNSSISPVETLLELRKDVIPMLTTLGSSLHVDPLLMYKVLRMSQTALMQMEGYEIKEPPEGDSLYFDVITILDTAILPSLSYLENNCSMAEEIWNLMKFLPYHRRYCLYSRWKNDFINDDAVLIHKNAEALKVLKNLMKRVSKENIKPIGRLLGKVTHACPGVLFDYVLIQLQTFENLIGPVVDSLKFLTSLSYDVLGFCIVETLAKASLDKSRAKYDGSTVSNWLQALASFCGAAYKKYNIELTGLLQFVANQLKDKNSIDLLIVREVVVKMAGIEASEEMTNDQLSALSGGELLKGEAGYYCQVRNTKKSSQRLKDALNEYNLGPALCLLMAQQRYGVVFKDDEATHLKHVARLYDQCQDTLVQFGTFLGSSLTVDEYVSKFPSVHAMLSEYHINGDVAFFLARPTLNHAISQKYESLRKADGNVKKLTTTAKQTKYIEAVNCVLLPLVESVRSLQPASVWEEISPQFFVTFWSLSMYDLFVPTEIYNREIAKLKKLGLQTLDSKELPSNKIKKESERYNVLMDKLAEEQKKQTEHVEKVMARLKQEKTNWFIPKTQKAFRNESIVHFLQLCVFPRCRFTASDAIYCAKFITTMHALGTENFSTVVCLDRLFCDVSYTVTMCTENEAHRYGRFLGAMLETVLRWHSSSAIFNEECLNSRGFDTKFRSANQNNTSVSFEPYRDLCHKWFFKLTRALIICLDSKDFNQIRNALIILIKILPFFPKLARLAGILSKSIEKIREEEKQSRPDLYTLATSYYGQLKAKGNEFVREADFHNLQPKEVKEDKKEEVVVVVDDDKKTEKKESKADKIEKKPEVKSAKPADSPRERETRERSDREKEKDKEKEREKKEAHRERARERKEERHAVKEERSYYKDERYTEKEERDRYASSGREERYVKDERYSGGGSGQSVRGGYYAPLSPDYSPTSPVYHPTSPVYHPTDSQLSEVSNSPDHTLDHDEPDRDVKRRKLESSSKARSPEWVEPVSSTVGDKPDKKERASRSKDKAPRKERKSTRKRDRHPEDESPPVESPKLRKDEDLGGKSQNGSQDLDSHRSKRSSYDARDKTPVYGEDGRRERDRERERSRDKPSRDKHRRTETTKRR